MRWTALSQRGALFKSLVTINRTDSTGTNDQTPAQFASRSDFNRYPIAFSNFTSIRASTSYQQQRGETSWLIMPFIRYQDVDFVPGWQLTYNPVVWLFGETSGGLRTQIRHDVKPFDLRLTFGIDADYTDGDRQEPKISPVDSGRASGSTGRLPNSRRITTTCSPTEASRCTGRPNCRRCHTFE